MLEGTWTPPRRVKSRSGGERRSIAAERRRSLFGLSGVSPLSSPEHGHRSIVKSPGMLSPSWSEDSRSPVRRSPRHPKSPAQSKSPGAAYQTPTKSPFKSLENDFTQMALTRTPENRIHPISVSTSKRSPRVGGIRQLSPDRGLISPKTFYGNRKSLFTSNSDGKAADGKKLYESIRESVRVRLPMETIPRENKKRARSSGSSSKRAKKIPRYCLFEEKQVKPVKKEKTAKTPSRTPSRKSPKGLSLEEEVHKARSEKKREKKLAEKYNWHFFNTRTPTSSRISKIIGEWSPSALTPPPTIRKRKLLSAYDLDHLPGSEEVKENAPTPADKTTELDLAQTILADFDSDNEDEVSKPALTVDSIIENLNQEVSEALSSQPLQEVKVDGPGSKMPVNYNSPKKYFSLFNMASQKSSPTTPKSQSYTPSAKKRRTDPNQLILDVGQSSLRETVCSECGLLYVNGDDSDMAFHDSYHRKSAALKFTGVKNAHVVKCEMGGSMIVTVRPTDPASLWEKAKKVLDVVDQELGYPPNSLDAREVYFFMKSKEVVGCLSAHPLTHANRVIPMEGIEAELCTEEQFPVKVGVSRIWVSPRHRREGIASQLMDALRKNFEFGKILKIDEVAFSSPTEDGKRFAAKYCKRDDFLIYTFTPSYLEGTAQLPLIPADLGMNCTM